MDGVIVTAVLAAIAFAAGILTGFLVGMGCFFGQRRTTAPRTAAERKAEKPTKEEVFETKRRKETFEEGLRNIINS